MLVFKNLPEIPAHKEAQTRYVWPFGDVGFFGMHGEEVARITAVGYPMIYRPDSLTEIGAEGLAEIVLAYMRWAAHA